MEGISEHLTSTNVQTNRVISSICTKLANLALEVVALVVEIEEVGELSDERVEGII
jgi:hypothetical protein